MVWECKRMMLTVKGDGGLPGETNHLLCPKRTGSRSPADGARSGHVARRLEHRR
jgi:hypothetical protein